jgi:arsenate reductase-like glutaredoxin family protein
MDGLKTQRGRFKGTITKISNFFADKHEKWSNGVLISKKDMLQRSFISFQGICKEMSEQAGADQTEITNEDAKVTEIYSDTLAKIEDALLELQQSSSSMNQTMLSHQSTIKSPSVDHQQRLLLMARQLSQFEQFRAGFEANAVTIHQLRTRRDALKQLRERYEATMLEHLEALVEPDDVQAKKEAEDSHAIDSVRFFEVLAWFSEEVDKLSPDISTKTISARRPKMENPTFDGKAVNWLAFHDLFVETVHRANIPTCEKFHILRSSLKLPAGEISVLDAFPHGSVHYDAAWAAVVERYDDKRPILAAHFNQLRSVKPMSKESSEELRRVIDSFSTNLKALGTMGYEIGDNKFVNVVVVQLMLQCLDKQTLKEWKKSTEAESPTYEELNKFLLGHWKALSDLSSK